jgi:hypothetical protein
VDQQNSASQKAILSFNSINILESSLSLKFRIYNPQLMNIDNMNHLIELFFSADLDTFTWEAMLPIGVKLNDIDPSCISCDINFYNVPLFRLTDARLQKAHIIAYGECHHCEAVKGAVRSLQKKLNEL